MDLKIYDGAEGIGGSKIYLREGDKGVLLDFGLNFNIIGLYFKEFIFPRPIRGLNDPIEMGLLPPINVYRQDLWLSDLNVAGMDNIPVDAVLLTHAHMDHYGMIGYLDFSISLVASPETLAIIKAYQDTGKSDIATSVIYSPIREEIQSSIPILRSMGNRIGKGEESIRKYLKLRKLIPTENLNANMKEFLYLQNNELRERYLRENLKIGELDSLPFKVKAFQVDHSIYGSVGYLVELDNAKVAYTGDIRLHGERGGKTLEFAEQARGSDILIIEGTRVSDEREHNFTTEREVFENCSEAVSKERKLIIADFSARNFERLNMFAKIAGENGRSLVVTDKDAYAIHGLLSAGTKIDVDNILVYDKPAEKLSGYQKVLHTIALWENRYVTPVKIREEQENYILAFSLYDMPNIMDIKPTGGSYLYSSTEAFDEEMQLDFITLNNWLKKYDFKSVGFKFERGALKFEKGYHASGHASAKELYKIISRIDPDIIIPVHTTNPQWFAQNFEEKTKILKNGESMSI